MRRELTALDRVLLLITGSLAAYQIVVGVEGFGSLALWSFSLAFGVLLVAGLLMMILGFEVLNSPLVIVVGALLPLSFSLGLVAEYQPRWSDAYLAISLGGLAAIALTRYFSTGSMATASLALVHGLSGLVIFLLPIWLVYQQLAPIGILLVAAGGGLIGLAGLLLMLLRLGKPLVEEKLIFALLPWLLLVMTAAFVLGLWAP
ncbi:MAG: hypothetical protein ACLFWD_11330 [Anaerolineales bacterium]